MLARIKSLLRDPMVAPLLSKGLAALLIKVGSAAISFVMFVLISNVTTTVEYGQFAIGFSLAITMSMVAGLGLSTAVLRFLPQYHSESRPDLEAGFLRFSVMAALAAPIIISALLWLGLSAYSELTGHAVPTYLVACLALLIAMALGEFASSALRAFGYTVMSLAPRDIIWRALVCLIAVILAWRSVSIGSSAILLGLALLLMLVVIWQGLHASRYFRAALKAPRFAYDFRNWRTAIWPMWGASVLYAFAQQFDIVVVGYFLSPTQSAPYFAAIRTASMLSLLLIAGNLISAPLISKLHFAGDRQALQRMVRILSVAIAVPTLVGYLLLVLVGQHLLALFNPAFVEAYPLLLILGAGFAFDAVAGPTGYMLQMVGHEKTYLKIMGGTYLLALLCQCLLAPHFGAVGVAIPTALGLMLANILIIYNVRTKLGIDPSLFGLVLGLPVRAR